MKKYRVTKSSRGDQYFIMLGSEIVKVFMSRKHARDGINKMNKLLNTKIIKKGNKNG